MTAKFVEPREAAMAVAGEDLTFDCRLTTLQVVFSFDIYSLELSPHGNEQQERYFSCLAIAAEVVKAEIEIEDCCYFQDATHRMDFKLTDIVPELDGWALLKINLEDVSYV